MVMPETAIELARRLAKQAEAVCRYYLSSGRREGRYWRVGDVKNAPGRSMYVRLTGVTSGKGAAGKWTDAATGEHGDLLDVIAESCGLPDFAAVAEEARRFLNLPWPMPAAEQQPKPVSPGHLNGIEASSLSVPGTSTVSAQRLLAMSVPIPGTIAEAYLRGRGISNLHETTCLRFHPRCYYRTDTNLRGDDRAAGNLEHAGVGELLQTWPALIAAVTNLDGTVTGVQRTYLNASGRTGTGPSSVDKAPVQTPRRAMGYLLGNGVRFGVANDVMAAGEGIETMLSLRCVMPDLSLIAALSATHLGAVLFPPTLRRLYVARDNDAAGDAAFTTLAARAREAGIEVLSLRPALRDFNDDLRQLCRDDFQAALRVQLVPEDVPRFMSIR